MPAAQEQWSYSEVRKLVALMVSEQVRTVFDALPVGVGILSSEGRVIWANRTLRELEPAIRLSSADILAARDQTLRDGTGHNVTIVSGMAEVPLYVCASATELGGAIIVSGLTCSSGTESLRASKEADNLSAVEECLVSAFPNCTIRRTDQPYCRFTITSGEEERIVNVTSTALSSPHLRDHLRDVPEALNFARSILLTDSGITLG